MESVNPVEGPESVERETLPSGKNYESLWDQHSWDIRF